MSGPVAPAGGEFNIGSTRPLSDLRDTGLLWLLNRVVFHPRGYAFGLVFEETDQPLAEGGTVIGWTLSGDGSEPWSFGETPPELVARGFKTEDDLFRAVKELMP